MKPKYRLRVTLVAVKDDRKLAPRAPNELVLLDLRLSSLQHWHSLLTFPLEAPGDKWQIDMQRDVLPPLAHSSPAKKRRRVL